VTHTADQVVAAYTDLVAHIEQLILAGIPAPFRRVARGLTAEQRQDVAVGLAQAARIAARAETQTAGEGL
jgi:hypothetical protein